MKLACLLALYFLFSGTSALSDTTASSCGEEFQENQSIFNGSGIHLTLHHVHGPCSPLTTPQLPVSSMLEHDQARVQSLEHRLTKSRITTTTTTSPRTDKLHPESVGLPLNPGKSIGIGNYIIRLGLGTPSKTFVMVMDTGSSFNWVQCEPCKVYCHTQVGPRFNPAQSNTYTSLKCGTAECSALESATLNPPACTNLNTCIYEASYGDSSFSVGYLSRDTLAVSPTQRFPGFVYGCGQDNEGLFGQSAGLVGLAKHRLSLLSQLGSQYGYAFAYCLPTERSSGSLSIGRFDPSRYTFTPMHTDAREKTLYFLKMVRFTVAGRPLALSAAAYGSSPMIIDSGTVITRLPPAVYTALSEAFVGAMKRYTRAPAYSILDTCYKKPSGGMVVPEVRMVFEGETQLRLAQYNVMIDVEDGTTCLAFAPNSGAGALAIVGNRQQQTFSVAYDVANSRIGFAPGGCR